MKNKVSLIHHDYSFKFYISKIGSSFFRYFTYFVRRVNIYVFNIKKALLNKKTFSIFIFTFDFTVFFIKRFIFWRTNL